MKKSILVICAHPDDETLGLGGTLFLHTQKGDTVNVAIFTSGQYGRDNTQKGIKIRKDQAKKACSSLGIKNLIFFDFPDQELEKIDLIELSSKIEIMIKKFKPEIVFTHYWGDVNQDHRRLFEASLIACRPDYLSSIERIICYETPSSTEFGSYHEKFNPNYFVDVSQAFPKKIHALKQYKKELRKYPHPRSLEAIKNRSEYWGQCVGVKKAEAFFILRHIEKKN